MQFDFISYSINLMIVQLFGKFGIMYFLAQTQNKWFSKWFVSVYFHLITYIIHFYASYYMIVWCRSVYVRNPYSLIGFLLAKTMTWSSRDPHPKTTIFTSGLCQQTVKGMTFMSVSRPSSCLDTQAAQYTPFNSSDATISFGFCMCR